MPQKKAQKPSSILKPVFITPLVSTAKKKIQAPKKYGTKFANKIDSIKFIKCLEYIKAIKKRGNIRSLKF